MIIPYGGRVAQLIVGLWYKQPFACRKRIECAEGIIKVNNNLGDFYPAFRLVLAKMDWHCGDSRICCCFSD